MVQGAAAQKRPVNMTLSVDLVNRARAVTKNLSETVESLLLDYVTAQEARLRHINTQYGQWVEASSEAVARHGSPADEYSPF